MYRVLLPDYFDDIKAKDEDDATDKFINELRDLLNNKTIKK
jgi:hypothetical protein